MNKGKVEERTAYRNFEKLTEENKKTIRNLIQILIEGKEKGNLAEKISSMTAEELDLVMYICQTEF